MADNESEYKKLRKMFNPAIRGKNTEAILTAIGAGTKYLTNNVEAVHDQIYICSASGRYLDQRLADYNLIRPANVGLSDEIFQQIGIDVINRKQIRDLINNLLFDIFGDETTNATARSSTFEPYALENGDTLLVKFDGVATVSVPFTSDQFTNINAATAQEVADAITRSLRKQGKNGRAFAKDDGQGAFVVLISDTIGPSSSVVVMGGRAQNELKFPQIRPTTAGASTQWTVAQVSGGSLRFTWSGGASPAIGKVRADDYVNIYGTAFNAANRGTFTVTTVHGGTVGNAYFEVDNPNGVSEIVVQGTVDSILFFYPFRSTINTRRRYAAAFQTEARLLEIFIPATTRVVRRDRAGSAHLHEPVITTVTRDPGLNEIFDIVAPSPGALSDGQYMTFESPNTQYYLYFDTTGANATDPAPGGTGVRVVTFGLTTAAQVAAAMVTAFNGIGEFNSTEAVGSSLRVTTLDVGAVTAPVNVNVPGMTVTVFQVGIDASETTTSVPNPDEGLPDQEGPYIYDTSQPFTISDIQTVSAEEYNPDTGRVLAVNDSSTFPDEQGQIILGYGTSHQEGPIPYLARPSNGSLLLNPSYRIKNIHPVGTDVALVAENGPVRVAKDGSDFPFYITDIVAGRVYAEDLIKTVAATGINVLITIIYPGDEGLGKWGTSFSEKTEIWGE